MSGDNQSIRILVVEDNPGDLFLLEDELRSTDLRIGRISSAGTLDEAKKMLANEEIDLVFPYRRFFSDSPPPVSKNVRDHFAKPNEVSNWTIMASQRLHNTLTCQSIPYSDCLVS